MRRSSGKVAPMSPVSLDAAGRRSGGRSSPEARLLPETIHHGDGTSTFADRHSVPLIPGERDVSGVFVLPLTRELVKPADVKFRRFRAGLLRLD